MSLLESAAFGLKHYTIRRWNCLFGIPLEAGENLAQNLNIDHLKLLWCLYFFRRYQPQSVCASWASVDEKTFNTHVMRSITKLDQFLPPVSCFYFLYFGLFAYLYLKLNFEDRWDNWEHLSPSCIADGTPIPILDLRRIPWCDRSRFYSVKVGGPALQYVFLVHVETGRFLHVSKAYPGGTFEPNIVHKELDDSLIFGEKIMADLLFKNDACLLYLKRKIRLTLGRLIQFVQR